MSARTCAMCGAEWDPEFAIHKSGPDCVPLIAAQVRDLRQGYRILKDSFESTKAEMAEALKMVEKFDSRIAGLGKRLNVIEHPKMKGVVKSDADQSA